MFLHIIFHSNTGLELPPMTERQRSLPRSVRQQSRPQPYLQPPPQQQQQQQQQQQHHQQQQFHHGRTNSMGRLDPSRPLASGSQPCLLVAQTVSNRRKRHQQDQKMASTTHSRPVTTSLSKKKNFQRSESFHQPQPHFFVNAQLDQVKPNPFFSGWD